MADQQSRTDLRAQLESERLQLVERIRELSPDSEAGLEFDENFADSAQVAAEQGETQALAASLRDQLDEVDRALRKMDEGTYGLCERCGGEIEQARLEAMPATPYCRNCAA